ncbi:MAG: DUF1844 domain-containing protein [Planctomycetota bacterium]|jgi:hypothetical protein
MTDEKKQDEKIIIDEDWKQQAQKEKEVLAAKEEVEKEKTQQQQEPSEPLPKGDFAALVSMLVTQVLFALGMLEMKGQEDEKRQPDLNIAKYNIDMLEALEEKTKGNLTEQEEKMLQNTLEQVRMAYVKVAG